MQNHVTSRTLKTWLFRDEDIGKLNTQLTWVLTGKWRKGLGGMFISHAGPKDLTEISKAIFKEDSLLSFHTNAD